MDSRFLELWGNFLLSAAKGQKQMEEMARWMGQGFKAAGFEDLAAMLTKVYGLGSPGDAASTDVDLWEAAAGQFRRSFEEWMVLMGMVSKAEYQALRKKYDALKRTCADQQETIRRLRDLLGVGKSGQDEAIKEFQAILEKQSTQFNDLISSSTQFLKDAAASKKSEK